MKKINYKSIAKNVIDLEILALKKLKASINKSFLDILPKSPCEHSFADKEKEGQPTEEKVADILLAIK